MTDKAKILIILTSHHQLGESDELTGFWWEEFATPYRMFVERGHEVVLASPKGGRPPHDPASLEELDETPDDVAWFMADDAAMKSLNATRRLESVDFTAYSAVFFPGGHGPMWDLSDNAKLGRELLAAHRAGVILSAVCHGPAAFLSASGRDGNVLLDGTEMTGFSNEEEQQVGLDDVVPFLLESELRAAGADYQKGRSGDVFVVRDRLLITGQNPASSRAVAEEILAALDE